MARTTQTTKTTKTTKIDWQDAWDQARKTGKSKAGQRQRYAIPTYRQEQERTQKKAE